MHCLCRLFLMLALALGLPWPGHAMVNPSEAEFTRSMAERIRNAQPGSPVRITGPLELRLGDDGEEGATINVGRIYNYCASSTPEDCETTAANFVVSVTDISSLPDVLTRDQLRVAVRHTDFCAEVSRLGDPADPSKEAVFRPLAPQICAVLMADFPTLMRSVNRGDLETLGLAVEEAWTLGERQTLANLPDPAQLSQLGEGMVVITDYEYVPSLLLNTDSWRRAEGAAGGELIFAIPADGLFVVIRRSLLTDLDGYRATTRESFETAERGISPLLYRLTDAGWVPFE